MDEITTEITPSFNVQIWLGISEGYGGYTHLIEEVVEVCQKFVDKKKECVTITPTEFVYTGGCEPGVVIGFIMYPRFVRSQNEIVERAVELGKILLTKFKQNRITITTPLESIMLKNKNAC